MFLMKPQAHEVWVASCPALQQRGVCVREGTLQKFILSEMEKKAMFYPHAIMFYSFCLVVSFASSIAAAFIKPKTQAEWHFRCPAHVCLIAEVPQSVICLV